MDYSVINTILLAFIAFTTSLTVGALVTINYALYMMNRRQDAIALAAADNVENVRNDLKEAAIAVAANVENVKTDLKIAVVAAAHNVENVRTDLKTSVVATAVNVENVRTALFDQHSEFNEKLSDIYATIVTENTALLERLIEVETELTKP